MICLVIFNTSSEHRFYRLLIGMIMIVNNMNINRNVKIIKNINTNRKTKTNVTMNKNTKNNIYDHVSLFVHINIVNYLYFFYGVWIQLLYSQQSLLRFIVFLSNNLLSFIVFLFNKLLNKNTIKNNKLLNKNTIKDNKLLNG